LAYLNKTTILKPYFCDGQNHKLSGCALPGHSVFQESSSLPFFMPVEDISDVFNPTELPWHLNTDVRSQILDIRKYKIIFYLVSGNWHPASVVYKQLIIIS